MEANRETATDARPDTPYGIAPPGYRLPSATHVGRVRLQVSDLTRSLRFYEETLGLRVLHRTIDRATLGPHDDDTPLAELHERKGARAVPRRGRLGLYHFAIRLPDRAALGRLIAHLAETDTYAGMSDHAVSEAVYLQDPDNLGIEVYADRPRDTWRYEGRQLAMITAPLDARDLVRAAGGERWSGMPAGTTIGHIHLHVGDLSEAEAFYHAALGFDKVVWSYPGALFLSAGGYHHHLGTNVWAASAPRADAADAQLLEWELVVPRPEDAEAAARSLEAAGYKVTSADRSWLAADLWGTTLRLVDAAAR
jgi:catechol 2,3-dioxygenase